MLLLIWGTMDTSTTISSLFFALWSTFHIIENYYNSETVEQLKVMAQFLSQCTHM